MKFYEFLKKRFQEKTGLKDDKSYQRYVERLSPAEASRIYRKYFNQQNNDKK